VSFSANGRQLVVTEKSTSLIDVYPVDEGGVAGRADVVYLRRRDTVGFAFGLRDLLFCIGQPRLRLGVLLHADQGGGVSK